MSNSRVTSSGRTVAHTLLIHYTLLNVLFLDDLLTMFESKGWQLIPAETAFQDPVFASKPDVVPAGDSIIWQLATATGKYKTNLENFDNEKKKLDRLGL
jgi:hypothetical protein